MDSELSCVLFLVYPMIRLSIHPNWNRTFFHKTNFITVQCVLPDYLPASNPTDECPDRSYWNPPHSSQVTVLIRHVGERGSGYRI